MFSRDTFNGSLQLTALLQRCSNPNFVGCTLNFKLSAKEGANMNTAPERQKSNSLVAILSGDQNSLRQEWMSEMTASVRAGDRMREGDLRAQCEQFLAVFAKTLQSFGKDTKSSGWEPVRTFLEGVSASRAQQGFSPSETASFVMSLKRPIFKRLQEENKYDAASLTMELWTTTEVLDALGLYTVESYIKTREAIIARQQEEMLELSTPVVKLWEGILALPLIGTLDSARTQVVMENLLQSIVQSNSKIAIIDITGVLTVDTIVAQHLLKTVAAARLMGADCIISGVRPQIAQTIVHLGINLQDITTKASLADAFAVALQRTGGALIRNGTSH
jgi:rsbT co-antagonist protein RsbR